MGRTTGRKNRPMAFDPMSGMIASYLESPKGKEAIHNFLASPQGHKTICDYLATPQGRETAKKILPCLFDALSLPPHHQAIILEHVRTGN